MKCLAIIDLSKRRWYIKSARIATRETLAFAASRINHIKLGALVTSVTYRHPGILVKTVTTLDVLSHGRAYFGIGAAWNEQEHRRLGVPFPSQAELFWLLGTSVSKKCRLNSHFICNFEPILIGLQFGTPYKHQPNGEGAQCDASEIMYG